jgi:orotidine-5'-phosphate decarboxylase
MSSPEAARRLIVALDFGNESEARELVRKLGDTVSFYKVGLELFIGTGFKVIEFLKDEGKSVFLDLKIMDVPETIEGAVRSLLGQPHADAIEFFTIQGNQGVAAAALRGRAGAARPRFLQVTMLSSWNEEELAELAPDGAAMPDLDSYLLRRTERIRQSGCEGVIASGRSVRTIRQRFRRDELVIVTPGIRPAGFDSDDHKRSLSPEAAIRDGADYLVVGRPIRRHRRPADIARRIIDDIERAATAIA